MGQGSGRQEDVAPDFQWMKLQQKACFLSRLFVVKIY